MHNHHRLQASVRAQFGATINFEAGTVKRAPPFHAKHGLRMALAYQGGALSVAPILERRTSASEVDADLRAAVDDRALALRRRKPGSFRSNCRRGPTPVLSTLRVTRSLENVDQAISHFRNALNGGKTADRRYLGSSQYQFQNVRPASDGQESLGRPGNALELCRRIAELRRAFRLNRFEFLLSRECDTDSSIGASSLRPIAFRVEK